MSMARAEELKRSLTNKYVVVREGVAELRRFVGLTGTVKTVNMSCRALVQFDGNVDISWYDIDPSYLTVVDQPLPKKAAVVHEKKAEKPAATPAAKPATGGKSPLELAREQAAAAGGEKKLSPLEQARLQGAGGALGEKKLSPLELARQQGAGTASTAEKKLSPLEQARLQGAGKAATPAAATPAAAPAPAPPPMPEPIAEAPAAAPVETAKPAPSERVTPATTAEILALARKQGALKG